MTNTLGYNSLIIRPCLHENMNDNKVTILFVVGKGSLDRCGLLALLADNRLRWKTLQLTAVTAVKRFIVEALVILDFPMD